MKVSKTIKILLVDDDLADRELFVLALSETNLAYHITECENGIEALDFLDKSGDQFPDIVFLDLNMPLMDGREALKAMKNKWPYIMVFILSTSNATDDVTNCYTQGANLFLIKPSDFNEIVLMLNSLLGLFNVSLAKPEQP